MIGFMKIRTYKRIANLADLFVVLVVALFIGALVLRLLF